VSALVAISLLIEVARRIQSRPAAVRRPAERDEFGCNRRRQPQPGRALANGVAETLASDS